MIYTLVSLYMTFHYKKPNCISSIPSVFNLHRKQKQKLSTKYEQLLTSEETEAYHVRPLCQSEKAPSFEDYLVKAASLGGAAGGSTVGGLLSLLSK